MNKSFRTEKSFQKTKLSKIKKKNCIYNNMPYNKVIKVKLSYNIMNEIG